MPNPQVAAARAAALSYGFRRLLPLKPTNPKIAKSDKAGLGFMTTIMHLAPAKLSGYEACPGRTAGCTKACLHTAGATHYQKVKDRVRIARTKFLFEQREMFKVLLVNEIQRHVKIARQHRKRAAVRLNGTSDQVFEVLFPEIFTMFPHVVFYDYTKLARRLDRKLPPNYKLTFSRAETSKNQGDAQRLLEAGHNVAVVFGGCGDSRFPKPLPESYMGRPVIDGDKHDLRFLDPKGVVVGLRAKGRARKQKGGFVVHLPVLATA